eukprot:352015-Chlamydomonas_euryale.AAC.3
MHTSRRSVRGLAACKAGRPRTHPGPADAFDRSVWPGLPTLVGRKLGTSLEQWQQPAWASVYAWACMKVWAKGAQPPRVRKSDLLA